MIPAWRRVCAVAGGVLFVAPLAALIGDLSGDVGGGPLMAGVIAGAGWGYYASPGYADMTANKGLPSESRRAKCEGRAVVQDRRLSVLGAALASWRQRRRRDAGQIGRQGSQGQRW